MTSPALQLDNVSVHLGGKLIVDSVSFRVPAGGIGCLLGASGCGKTTLLRAIAGFEPVSSGSVALDGLPISTPIKMLDIEKRRVGMVFQDHSLFPHLSVRQNIAFGLQSMSVAKREARIDELASLLAIGELLDAFPHRLSGGQQQRVAIARAMAPRPEVLLLDEPFSALDPLIRKEMQDEFLRLQGVLNKTILFVTHDFNEALRLADRIAIMKDGVIEQLDTPANIVLRPATEYVRKFTEEVPREKVLKIESVMDPAVDASLLGPLQVSNGAIIYTVAEAILTEPKHVAVINTLGEVVGSIHSAKIISMLFGQGNATHDKV